MRDGDVIRLDANAGRLECLVEEDTLNARSPGFAEEQTTRGVGRELFTNFRRTVSSAEQGATVLFDTFDAETI